MTYDGSGRKKRSLLQLIADVPTQLIDLFKAELQQLKNEMVDKVKNAGIGVGMLVAAGLFAFFALATFIATAVLGLAVVLAPWLAALIVAVLLLILAGMLGFVGMKMIKKGLPPMPEKSIRSMKEDVNALKGVGKYDH